MARTLPITIVNAIMSQETSESFHVLLTAEHSQFPTIRVVNNTQSITSNGEVFVPFPFSVILPPDSEDSNIIANVDIYDAEREVIDNLRFVLGQRERIKLTLQVVASGSPDSILQSVSNLSVVNVIYSSGVLRLEAQADTLLTEGYPRDSFTPANFPGVF
jgi:hypothetical protein